MKTMYAVTHIPSDGPMKGMRRLTFANQGRNHCETREEAQAKLDLLKDQLKEKILGKDADTLEVRPVKCYDHGDAMGIYFDIADHYESSEE